MNIDIEKSIDELKAKATPLNATKYIVGTLISFGAMAAIVAALKNPVAGAKGITKWMMRLGIFVLGCKAGDVAEKYFHDTFDDVVSAYKEVQKEEEPTHGKDPDGQ